MGRHIGNWRNRPGARGLLALLATSFTITTSSGSESAGGGSGQYAYAPLKINWE
jgi:hypothetical protein